VVELYLLLRNMFYIFAFSMSTTNVTKSTYSTRVRCGNIVPQERLHGWRGFSSVFCGGGASAQCFVEAGLQLSVLWTSSFSLTLSFGS